MAVILLVHFIPAFKPKSNYYLLPDRPQSIIGVLKIKRQHGLQEIR